MKLNWRIKLVLNLEFSGLYCGGGSSDSGYTFRDKKNDIINIPYEVYDNINIAFFLLEKANLLLTDGNEYSWKLKMALELREDMNYSGTGDGTNYTYRLKEKKKDVDVLTIPYSAEEFIENAWKLICKANNML